MKIAVSIPDSTFSKAEHHAKKMGGSRSKFYARALEEYIERIEGEATKRQLNELYSQEDSSLDPPLYKMQYDSINNGHGEW